MCWQVIAPLSYCTRCRRRRFAVLYFRSWAYSGIYGHFQQHFTTHAQKPLFLNFRCKCRHRRSNPRPWLPVRVQIFGDLVTFSVDFCILYAECPPYFYFRFVWPTDLESIPHASTPTSKIPTKFEVDMTIHCRVIAFLSAETTWPCDLDLDLWPFDVEQLTYMAGHVANLAAKFEDPTTIRSWVTSYNVFHWLSLKMRSRPLHMRRITWPVSRGSKTITYLEYPTPICLFTIQLLLGYDDD